MGFFSQRKKPEQIGLELSKRLKNIIETIPDTLSSIESDNIFSFKDVDKKILVRELIILTYVAQRLAVQLAHKKKGSDRDEDERRSICNALDSRAQEYLDNSPEFCDLLDQRGEKYFQLLKSYIAEVNRGDWNEFFDDLKFEFEQFARGGGGKNDLHIIGGFTSKVPLMFLATHYW